MKKLFILITTLTFTTLKAQFLNSMQACYPLACDHAQNYSNLGPSLNGTASNVNCTIGRFGLPATAYEFQGNPASYIELPNLPGILKPHMLTVSGWFKFNSITTPQYLIFTKNNCQPISQNKGAYTLVFGGSTSPFFYVVKNGSDIFANQPSSSGCGLGPSTNIISSNPSVNILSNRWYHVVIYVSEQKIWLYVDNQLQGSVSNLDPIDYDPTGLVYLGSKGGFMPMVLMQMPVITNFNGVMQDVRFFLDELSPLDVDYLYTTSMQCLNESGQKPTSIQSISYSPINLKLYPNPNNGKFILESESEINFTITDISGKTVSTESSKLSEHKTEIKFSQAKAGLYFINVLNDKGDLIRTEKMAVVD